jgi:hypothetical protein
MDLRLVKGQEVDKMTVESITNRLNQYFPWLSSRQLEEWWPVLLAIAALVLILIVLLLRSRRKVLPDNDLLRDIIDIKLADRNKTNHQTDCVVDGRSANVPEKHRRRKRRINTTKGFKIAIKELKQRHNEIIKSRQAELLTQQKTVRLAAVNEQLQSKLTDNKQVEELPTQKVAEIAAVIEQFQHEITDSKQTEQRPVQKVYEIVPDNEPFQIGVANSSQAEQHPIQKVSGIAAFNEQFQQEKLKQEQPEKVSEESSEQDLKSKKQSQPFDIAEFSKAAISRRQRQRLGIFNEDTNIAED